jgi:sodium transport system permease protein
MRAAWPVFIKELLDALRDRRTLLVVLLGSVAIGPFVLVLLSTLVGQMEQRAEARRLVVVGIEHAPTLRNFLERQTFTLEVAPADHERLLKDSKLGEPVLVVPDDFEAGLLSGESPRLLLLTHSGNQRASAGTRTAESLLQGFNREQALLRLSSRGVAPGSLEAVEITTLDLADRAGRAAQLTTLVPFFVLMAVLYGALTAALDTTAGERERGSLEPLLMNPLPRLALVLGKWGAVAAVGMLIAVLSCLSFLPGQWLMRSEALQALFQYGPREALGFIGLLIPLAAALAAVLMAVAIRCKTFKEAQANSTLVLLATSLIPMVAVFNQQGTEPWHLWVPALAQLTLMARLLRGEVLPVGDVATTVLVAAVVTVLALLAVARSLKVAALK